MALHFISYHIDLNSNENGRMGDDDEEEKKLLTEMKIRVMKILMRAI